MVLLEFDPSCLPDPLVVRQIKESRPSLRCSFLAALTLRSACTEPEGGDDGEASPTGLQQRGGSHFGGANDHRGRKRLNSIRC